MQVLQVFKSYTILMLDHALGSVNAEEGGGSQSGFVNTSAKECRISYYLNFLTSRIV